MIYQWYAPLNLKEWLKRSLSFLNLSILLLTALFVFSEFRYDWCEKLLGRYLAATNHDRPETGTIWKTGKHTMEASRFLNDIIQKKQQATQEVEKAASFVQLAEGILPGEWVTLEKDHFKTLYLSLPETVSRRLISPARLIWLLSGNDLDRIFCEGMTGGMNIYFLDAQNRVIHQVVLSREDIVQIQTGAKPISSSLDEMDGYANRIFTARQFFEAVFTLPEDIIPDLILNPDLLLNESGHLVRVGIGDEARAGFINLAFEYEMQGRKRVIVVKGREWAVWQLSLILKGDTL